MIKLAIVGFGQHVQKNILPALLQIPDLMIVCVYVRNTGTYLGICERLGIEVKPIEAIGKVAVDYTYIATPLSTHFDLAQKSLYGGSNVICEKPLTDSLSKTSGLFKAAAAKNLKLYEVCMYRFHKQYRHLKKLIEERHGDIRSVRARFMVPHLDQRNIRYNSSLGGGALFDVGYYPISLFAGLFGRPRKISSAVYFEEEYSVDTFGTALFGYETFYCHADWAIGSKYQNSVTIDIAGCLYEYERIFSKPPTYQSACKVISEENTDATHIGEDDQLRNMFFSIFYENLLETQEHTELTINLINEIALINKRLD